MKKSEIFATIKEANIIVDEMKKTEMYSKEYNELNETLGWTLDRLIDIKCPLRLSYRTGHYYVKF